MEKGTLVEFRVGGDRRLAVIDRPEGKKNFIAIDERGHSHTLHPRQIDYQIPGQDFKFGDITAFLNRAQDYVDPSSLEIAWELVTEEGGGTDPKSLAQILFSETSAEPCYASHLMLSDDRFYFKQKGDRYEPRSANQVNELKHQLQMEQQRQQEWESLIQRLKELVVDRRENPNQPTPTWQPSERLRIDALERFATFGDESSSKQNALETLSTLNSNGLNISESSQGALQLLVDLGVWSAHENLFLRRSYMSVQFTPTVTDLAHDYLASAPADLDPDRLDLTHLKVYTIDDESTLEVDDGLSIEVMPDGRERVWVHIADPTRWMVPGDQLDLEARKRCTTIYLPTGMVSMLPLELASGPMSLNAGEVCCALSFGILLGEDGSVEDYTIHPSHIKITYRLTYEDVEEMLELGLQTESALESLAKWARLRKSWRQAQGAITIDMPESSIKVINDGEDVQVQVMPEVFSRDLVAEMMIMTGEVAARYGSQHGIPLLFRGQTQPDLPTDDELLVIPAGPARACALRRCMPKSEMNTTPVRHASLGLDYYAQVTSPIRRYSDLLAHFQLKAHLRGDELPFSEVEVEHITTSILSTVQESNFLERQTNRYWSVEFLRRNSDEVWSALMLRWLREHEGLASVLLEDLGMEIAMHFDRPISPGDRLQLRVLRADPRRDIIDFQEVHHQLPEEMMD